MGSEPQGPVTESVTEPRPPFGSWPRLYALVLGMLALEIVVLRLLPMLVSLSSR